MKIETVTEVKKHLTRIVRELPGSGMVVVTRDGVPAAVLMEVTPDTDLEVLALSASRRFWHLWERADRGPTVALDDVEVRPDEARARADLVASGTIVREPVVGYQRTSKRKRTARTHVAKGRGHRRRPRRREG